ncbi:hypothetical protein GF407_00440 [candidate division KSB1 bacterium]|nr:hypothetical protein [candidate division KSB1 bacterium]
MIIHLGDRYYAGGSFVIETINNGPKNVYIQSAQLNGNPLQKTLFYHEELIKGGKLELTMGSMPNSRWGSGPDDAPPSMSDEK